MEPEEQASWDAIMAAFRQGEVAHWVALCRRHLATWVQEPGPWLMLGHGLGSVGRYREARRIFGHLEVEPLLCEFQAEMNETRGRLKTAARWWKSAARLQPHKSGLHISRGRVWFRLGRWQRARKAFWQAGPDPHASFWLGQVARAEGDFLEAARHFNEAGDWPGAVEARDDVLKAAGFSGQADELEVLLEPGLSTSVVMARNFLRREPRNLDVRLRLASSLVSMGCFRKALETYWALGRELGPGHPLCCTELGLLYHSKGRYEEAIRWFSRLTRAEPDDSASWVFLGSSQARRGKMRQAEECHRRATRCPRGNLEEAWLNLGLVLRAMERLGEAREAFQNALSFDPEYAKARQGLADVEKALLVC